MWGFGLRVWVAGSSSGFRTTAFFDCLQHNRASRRFELSLRLWEKERQRSAFLGCRGGVLEKRHWLREVLKQQKCPMVREAHADQQSRQLDPMS